MVKRFHFRLERVLKWKQQRQRQAELLQQAAQLAWTAAQAEVQELQARFAQAARALEGQIGQAVPIGAWLAKQAYGDQIRQALESAEARFGVAAQKLREAAAQRTQIATEVEALLILRRQQGQAHKEEATRTEQQRLDEVGLRRWQLLQDEETLRQRPPPEGEFT